MCVMFLSIDIYFIMLQKHKESREKGASSVDEKRFNWSGAEGIKSRPNCKLLFLKAEFEYVYVYFYALQFLFFSSQSFFSIS